MIPCLTGSFEDKMNLFEPRRNCHTLGLDATPVDSCTQHNELIQHKENIIPL